MTGNWIFVSFCLRAPWYGLTLWCAFGLLVGGAIQVPQLQLQFNTQISFINQTFKGQGWEILMNWRNLETVRTTAYRISHRGRVRTCQRCTTVAFSGDEFETALKTSILARSDVQQAPLCESERRAQRCVAEIMSLRQEGCLPWSRSTSYIADRRFIALLRNSVPPSRL